MGDARHTMNAARPSNNKSKRRQCLGRVEDSLRRGNAPHSAAMSFYAALAGRSRKDGPRDRSYERVLCISRRTNDTV